MTDIVERLHNLSDDLHAHPVGELWAGLDDAADEIEALRAGMRMAIVQHEAEIGRIGIAMGAQADEIERLRAALARLVTDYEDVPDPTDDDGQAVFQQAREALATLKNGR
jgi:hypothetical protein